MQIHQLKPSHKKKKKKRIGRGGKRGTFCGRGSKGQKARSGRKLAPLIREMIKRYPKLRGYRYGSLKEKKGGEVEVKLSLLEKEFKNGEKITPKILLSKGIIHKIKGKTPQKIKIIGGGKGISKKLFIEKCEVSQGAREKIEKAGGKIF